MNVHEEYLVSVLHGRPGVIPALLRSGLGLLSPVYTLGLKSYLLPYRLGWRRRARLPCPVCCVGNLTTGGVGKTPMTQTICRRLQTEGLRVAVLLRGYGGKHEYGAAIVSDGSTLFLDAGAAGDEAFLLAATLPEVPVVVGKDRRVTGALAVERFRPDVLVLDDGMQFWQLHRDLDIVLLNACSPFDNGWTFPRGLLREPPSNLDRAGLIVLTNARSAGPERVAEARNTISRLAPHAPVFTADLAPAGLLPPAGAVGAVWPGHVFPLEQPDLVPGARHGLLKGEGVPLPQRVAALCAIGNPASFEYSLRQLGMTVARQFHFRDHHRFLPEELDRVFEEARLAGVEAIVTTEKDVVRMPVLPPETPIPLLVLAVRMEIAEEDAFFTHVRKALECAPRSPA